MIITHKKVVTVVYELETDDTHDMEIGNNGYAYCKKCFLSTDPLWLDGFSNEKRARKSLREPCSIKA